MKHVKIVNRKSGETLPMTAAECWTLNLCYLVDRDDCNNFVDVCTKDYGEKVKDDNNSF